MSIRIIFIIIAVIVLATGCDWVERSSVSTGGVQGNGPSIEPAVSDDGQIVAFASIADNLVVGDTNGAQDIFVRDHAASTTTRVSVASDGTEGNGGAYRPALSDDGRYVVFHASSTNLVVGDTNGVWDVFRHDRVTGETIRVSTATDGTEANANAEWAAVDGDGSVVAFMSGADNLVAGDTNRSVDVFTHHVKSGVTSRVSLDESGVELAGDSLYPSIADSGEKIAFLTDVAAVAGDLNGTSDAYVVEPSIGGVVQATAGNVDDGHLNAPMISGNGEHLVFVTDNPHFFLDSNGLPDVYRVELSGAFVKIISSYRVGAANDLGSFGPTISDDGLEVSMRTTEAKLPEDTDGTWDVYVSITDPNGGFDFPVWILADMDRFNQFDGDSVVGGADISGDGRFLAFSTDSDNIVPGDSNGWPDIVNRTIVTPADLTAHPTNPTITPGATEVLRFEGKVIDPGANIYIYAANGLSIDGIVHTSMSEIEVTITADPAAPVGPRTFVVENLAPAWSGDAWSGDLCSGCVVVAP